MPKKCRRDVLGTGGKAIVFGILLTMYGLGAWWCWSGQEAKGILMLGASMVFGIIGAGASEPREE